MKLLFLLLLTTLLVGCSHQFLDEGEYFYISNGGANMPVQIRGEMESGTFCIYLHGGPGNSAVAEATLGNFRDIEKLIAMVYWDQRGAGLSDGNPELITNESIAGDLDILIQVLTERYGAKRIVLLGHSYGAVISGCYMSKSEQARKISGWIIINGTADLSANWQPAIKWVKDEIVRRGKSAQWSDVLSWYDSMDSSLFRNHEEVQRHLGYVDSLGGKFISDEFRPSASGEQVFFSPIGLGLMQNEKECGKKVTQWWNSNYSDGLAAVTTPFLLLTGRGDGVIPEVSSLTTFNSIGTDVSLKRHRSFTNSAHHPHFEETEELNREVIDFLELLQ